MRFSPSRRMLYPPDGLGVGPFIHGLGTNRIGGFKLGDTLAGRRLEGIEPDRVIIVRAEGKERAMARIKHIALSTDDPVKTAEFYKSQFGLKELRREPAATGADGVWLSDGYIYFAILKYGGDDTPNLGEGPSTVKGIHHIGFYVDDLEEASTSLEAASCTLCPGSSVVNRKFKGPDGVMIDVRARGWDEQIKARMQLYQLTPVSS